MFHPAYQRTESILFDNNYNPAQTNTELIKQEDIIEFLLLNSNNENTILKFLLNNCILNSKLCFNKFNVNDMIEKKILRLNNNLSDIKIKKENLVYNHGKINNRTYFNEYLNLLNGKYDEILNQINLFKNFRF
jgi:hypothetical protein